MLRHLHFRRIRRAITACATHEAWSRSQVEEHQLQRINFQWEHALRHVPYFREMARERKLPHQFRSLHEYTECIPKLSRSDLQLHKDRLLSEKPAAGHWTMTSGSTGTPTSVYRENTAELESRALHFRMMQMHGVEPGSRNAWLWGRAGSLAPGWKGHASNIRRILADRFAKRLRLDAYSLHPASLQAHARRLCHFRAKSLYGYATAILLLAYESRRLDVKLPDLRVAVMTSETIWPKQRARASECLGVPVICEYGSAELGVIAFHDQSGNMRVREDMSFVETIAQEDGRFELVVTRLNNPSFPLLRYATSDVVSLPLTKMEVGFATLGQIEGRVVDTLIDGDGGRVSSMRIEVVMESATDVRRYLIQQELDGSTTCFVEPFVRNEQVDRHSVHKALSALIRQPLVVEQVEQIPQTSSGKCRYIVSHLAEKVLRPMTGYVQT